MNADTAILGIENDCPSLICDLHPIDKMKNMSIIYFQLLFFRNFKCKDISDHFNITFDEIFLNFIQTYKGSRVLLTRDMVTQVRNLPVGGRAL